MLFRSYLCAADDVEAVRAAFSTYVTTLVYIKVDDQVDQDQDDQDVVEIVDE